jgi:hypothetical protein
LVPNLTQLYHQDSKATKRINDLIQKGQEDVAVEVDFISFQISEVQVTLDGILEMLIDKNIQESANKKIQENDTKRLMATREENAFLRGVLRARSVSPSPFQQSAWAPPPAPSPQPQSWVQMSSVDQEGLWKLLDIFDIDTADMERIEEMRERLPAVDRTWVEQVVHNQLFQKWIVTPRSAKLLVHGNFPGLMMETSALSLFCTTLTKALRARQQYLCLVWFCGRHLVSDPSDSASDSSYASDGDESEEEDDGYESEGDDDEEFYSPGTRPRAIKRMLRSLIAQLLCDHDFGTRNLLPPGANPFLIKQGNLKQLRRLFGWLVSQLPEEITLFCLIDGIIFYEREEFEDPMLDILGDILGLTVDRNLPAAVKVLVTSPWPTSTVRAAFEDEDGHGEDLILSMELLQISQWGPNLDRMNRELGIVNDELGDEQDSDE